jgi:hypothetical protein
LGELNLCVCASLFAHLLFCSLSSSLPRPHHSPVAARRYSALWPSSLLFGAWPLRHFATRQLGNSVAAAFGQLGDCWLLRPGAHPLWNLAIALLPWHFAISSLCYPSGWPLWCFAPPAFGRSGIQRFYVLNRSGCWRSLLLSNSGPRWVFRSTTPALWDACSHPRSGLAEGHSHARPLRVLTLSHWRLELSRS